MFVDIIIPVKQINDYIQESVPRILNLDYSDFGIIILPDKAETASFPKTTIIPTGPIGPAEKRDLAQNHSQADILAFLDDDAYPREDWLTKAVRHFQNPEVAAVGGPAVTPSDDTFFQRVSGAVFMSSIGGGNPERYWPIGNVREVDDWPSVNLLVRKEIFQKVGGFNSEYWPGEDTKLCLDIVQTGNRIIYDPEVFVWHHRREGLTRHLKQIGRYGLHRGFFAKRFPQTSLKSKYFIPSCFVLFLLSGILMPFFDLPVYRRLFLTGMALYFLTLAVGGFQIYGKEKNAAVTSMSMPYIFLTHIWYGIRFMQGFLLTRELSSQLRKT